VFGPLEVLHSLTFSHQLNLSLISGHETLDPVSNKGVAARMNPYGSSFYPSVLPTHTLKTAPKDLEVLIVPGGGWTRSPSINSTVEYVRSAYPNVKYLLTICTGAHIAALAGILDGKRATMNKQAWKELPPRSPKVKWQPRARWVVDGNIWTSSGVTAGIDMTLEFIECFFGEGVGRKTTTAMEHDKHADPRWDPFAVETGSTDA